MTVHVFLGPSLPLPAAHALLETAHFHPPAAAGDIYAVARILGAGDRILLIDGLFEQTAAVWHKELLFALERGVALYGASSMGALRAAELDAFGMIGIGRIYAAISRGELTDDDEVAVVHADATQGYRSLSAAMVSLRFGLAGLRDSGVLVPKAHDHLVAAMKALPYAERSWPAAIAEARRIGLGATALDGLRLSASSDAKSADARAALSRVAMEEGASTLPSRVDFTLNRTSFWTALTADRDARDGEDFGLDGAALDLLRAVDPARDAIMERATLMAFAASTLPHWHPQPADLAAAAGRLARVNRLSTRTALAAWRERNQVSDPERWQALLSMEARVAELVARFAPSLGRFAAAAAVTTDRSSAVRELAVRAAAAFGSNYAGRLTATDHAIDVTLLQQWYEGRCGPMWPDPERHARSLGFDGLRPLLGHMVAAYLLEASDAFDDPGLDPAQQPLAGARA
ncbi:TfuA-like protein [Sandaracinobacteroides saxicola]|uniref:TfuA-like core domain-containing protein n=1 Tax=Sandaracinobacteroides saxicola TaxID=2759707 RepID=A0A7G5IIS8_9SPHN|nr:TfuA-like protein [Sandaracinobacteroides saxicola]QMW23270.1 hypothetical protein H3309_01800 [Sandaracinobacteroides saxicola]